MREQASCLSQAVAVPVTRFWSLYRMQRRLKGEKIRRATEVFTLAMAKPDAAAALETAEMKVRKALVENPHHVWTHTLD